MKVTHHVIPRINPKAATRYMEQALLVRIKNQQGLWYKMPSSHINSNHFCIPLEGQTLEGDSFDQKEILPLPTGEEITLTQP